jgi:nucleoside-triphosphatase THEP1
MRRPTRTVAMKPAIQHIAALAGGDGVAALLAATVAAWRAEGVKVTGVTGELHGLPDRTCGAGFLRDIASDAPYRIYLETAPSHTSCHLDADGVATACAAICEQIPASDLVVLNKFGKLEAMGNGLAPAFELAVASGKPLLTTVSALHRDAWSAFAPQAAFLNADRTVLQEWWQGMRMPAPNPSLSLMRYRCEL